MALSIHDLPQSDDLDREAMRSIRGGGSTGAPLQIDRANSGSGCIVEYPPRSPSHHRMTANQPD